MNETRKTRRQPSHKVEQVHPKMPHISEAELILSYLKGEIEQIENPYPDDTLQHSGWNACQNQVLRRLSVGQKELEDAQK